MGRPGGSVEPDERVVDSVERIIRGGVAITARALGEDVDDLTFAQWRVLTLVGEPSPGIHVRGVGQRVGVETAPFFIVRDDAGVHVYTSVMRLIRDRLGVDVSDQEQAAAIDPDDIGGI